MHICTKCVLPDTFPGTTFNDDGVCNHCQNFTSFAATAEQREEYQQKLRDLLEANSSASPQALVAYSGGKDSTYTLWLLKKKYGADVSAFTFDNGFISPQATKNIKSVCSNLDVPHKSFTRPKEVLHQLFRHGANTSDMFPMKTMERASTICTICSGFFKSLALGYALFKDIPLIAYGWSPGQAPIQSALQKTNPIFTKMSQANAMAPVVDVIGESARNFFLRDSHYDIPSEKWPTNVHPLAFEDYNEEAIKDVIRTLGWVDPTDVDSNSTNCTMNAFANQAHIDKFGFHPYAMEIANMVRQGTMSREEGIEKVYEDQDVELINYARKEIGL